ncbi:TPA: glycosyltransferase family 2 protein [Candidatus Bathyarchaeota archaeon]|nr:glycosyltransferase family 2 protein [Candidatus Bathyarchaeota archaeon]
MNSDRVDVVVITKDSERMLERCLNSVFETVPVNRLIVVDGYSTDRTMDILSGFQKKHKNILVVKDRGTRGSARLKGIRLVETDWFLFVDSDVTLCDDWFKKALSHVNGDVGAVWGIEIWDGIQNSILLGLFLQITRRIFEIRGGTHDLLVRHDAVKDIDIPKTLHVFEDAFIAEWIVKKGFQLVATYDPYCIHYRPPVVWTFRGSVDIIVDSFKFGSIAKMPKLVMAYGFYAFYVLYRNLFERKFNLKS